jgi:hypothetical protein
MAELSAMEARAVVVAADVGVKLSRVDAWCDARRASVFVACDGADDLARGALHAALLHEFAADGFAALDVRVAPAPAGRAMPAVLASTWVAEQTAEAAAFARQLRATLALATYRRAVSAYPWRQRAAMAAMIPALVAHAVDAMVRGCAPEMGPADGVLPALEDVLPAAAKREAALAAVVERLGAPPATLLEFYEAVYWLDRAGGDARVAALAWRLFDDA